MYSFICMYISIYVYVDLVAEPPAELPEPSPVRSQDSSICTNFLEYSIPDLNQKL